MKILKGFPYTYSVTFISSVDVSADLGIVVGNQVIDIPEGSDVNITARDVQTNCSQTITITSPDCSCEVVAAPIGQGQAICFGDMTPLISASVESDETIDWYDAPFGGPKKDPLKLSNPDTVEKELRSVKDKNFPKFGGKGGKFVKIKKKCSKFPYCNQGDINALQIFERDIVKEMVTNTAKRTNLEEYVVRNIIAKELGYIQEQEEDHDEEFATIKFMDKDELGGKTEWIDMIPDEKAKFLIKELKDKEFEFNSNGLSGKVKILDVGPKGKIGGFFGVASEYDFTDSKYAEIWVELSDLKYKGKEVSVEFYDMISRYLPTEDEDSYRGDPIEYAILGGLEHVNRVMKSLGLHLGGMRINPYARFR